ncbi:MAG: hypothetical protein JW818_11570, partial [Pirellulales bacterium]|nr:hypothetical protein [Pirellulales bacterium]
MPHAMRIGGTLTTVLVAYWVYCLVAVPLIEPPFDPSKRAQVSDEDFKRAQVRSDRRITELAEFFPPGSPVLESPKIIQTDQAKLVVGEITPQPDGRVLLKPCTILYTPGAPDDPPDERRRRTIVLEVPEGALLRFDAPFDESFDLGGARKRGRLLDGELLGQTVIRGAGRPDDPSDDLWIATRQVKLDEERIWTPHPVTFRYGPHFGQGRQMTIRLLPRETDGSEPGQGPQVAGIKSFELVHVDRLHLEVPTNGNLSLGNTAAATRPHPAAAPPPSPNGRGKKMQPVEVSCAGTFLFDVIRKKATLRDRVEVVGIQPDGLHDRVSADVLDIVFESRRRKASPTGATVQASPPPGAKSKDTPPPTEPAEPPPDEPGPLELQPRLLEAWGNPVIVSSPHEQFDARGDHLALDLVDRRIELDNKRHEDQAPRAAAPSTPKTVWLRYGLNSFQATSLVYHAHPDPKRIGRLAAVGPGVLQGRTEKRPDDVLEVRFNDNLVLQPLKQDGVVYPTISLYGNPTLDYRGVGHLSADEMHVYFNEIPGPTPADRWRLELSRMQADRQVTITAPQLSSDPLDQLQVWFNRQVPALDPTAVAGSPGGEGFVPAVSNPAMGGNGSPEEPTNHFHVTAKQVLAEIALEEKRARLNELIVNGQVRLAETRTRRPDEKPFVVEGDQIRVHDASSPAARIIVVGQQAKVEGRGLGLTGNEIDLNRGLNRLQIEGPGAMDLPPLTRDLQGRKITSTGPMRVLWQRKMEFDGRTIRFLGSVVAASQDQQILTETLEADLLEPIRFSELKFDKRNGRDQREKQDLQEIRCLGDVTINSRTVENERLMSTENFQTRDLKINLQTGEVTAGGPGELTSRHYSTGRQFLMPGTNDTARPANGAQGKGARHLLCEAPEGPFRQKVPGTFSASRE